MQKRLTPDGLVAGHVLEVERMRRVLQALQVGIQAEDAPVVDAQALPDGISTLYHAVEDRYLGRLARVERTVDVDFDIVVFRIVLLKHGG